MKSGNITVAITGGIGSGKSVVSRILSTMGYKVYDCDSRAKALMDSNPEIKRRIEAEISPLAIVDGKIYRRALADIVFNNPAALKHLNSIVHSAVRTDFEEYRQSNSGLIFFETAILFESRFHTLADKIWQVIAPDELRIERVMRRNGMTRSEVESRIASQSASNHHEDFHNIETIINDGVMPLLQQVTKLLQIL